MVEAASMWVVLDLMCLERSPKRPRFGKSNFQPVFIVKIWIFLLAWYAYMSQDDRNGYFWYPTYKRVRIPDFCQIRCILYNIVWMYIM